MSSESAFAIALGRGHEKASGSNTRALFMGLRDLFLVEDKVEDGSELNYEECDVDEAELASFLCKKPDLALFSIESSRK